MRVLRSDQSLLATPLRYFYLLLKGEALSERQSPTSPGSQTAYQWSGPALHVRPAHGAGPSL